MKRRILISTLICVNLAAVWQSTFGQAPAEPVTVESASPQPATGSNNGTSTPAGEIAPPAPLEMPTSQEQLRWAEQRAAAAEEQARAADRTLPLLVLLTIFALPLSFAGGVYFARYRQYQHLNETLRGLLERGVTIPPEILTLKAPAVARMSDFRKGLLLISSGVSAMFLLGVMVHGTNAWSLGLIPTFIGLAYLFLWKLESRKELA